ncbi:MAG TPA: YcaO-like family protein [Gammaproteobacteria bacterium]|nr:YcaO-like family protein [Gammaproteobacteria bacterium]
MDKRSVSAKTAQSAWREVILSHDLTPVEKISLLHNQKTALCFLKKGPLTVRGAGKGKTLTHNKLSANYEALEFYLSGTNYNPYPSIITNQTEMAKQATIFPFRCRSESFLDKKNHANILPWAIYVDIKNDDKYAVPLASVDLSYTLKKHPEDTMDYSPSGFYCASNGLASGSTVEDALMHSVLELIERDAHSYFFIDTFLLNKKITAIQHDSLPEKIFKLVKKFEKAFSDELVLIHIPSRYDVPVYCAAFVNYTFENCPRGAGAALNPVVAMERAIYEAVQSCNLMQNNYLSQKLGENTLFQKNLAKNSASFPIKTLIQHNRVTQSPFEDKPVPKAKNSKAYLDILINKVYKYSKILVHIPYQDQHVACVRTIIPDAEEFFLICHGLKMYPNTTTQSYIQKQSGKPFSWDDQK